jgi:hypothetical protein
MMDQDKARLLAVILACRSARSIVVKYLDLMRYLKLTKEETTAKQVLHQIDDALK